MQIKWVSIYDNAICANTLSVEETLNIFQLIMFSHSTVAIKLLFKGQKITNETTLNGGPL